MKYFCNSDCYWNLEKNSQLMKTKTKWLKSIFFVPKFIFLNSLTRSIGSSWNPFRCSDEPMCCCCKPEHAPYCSWDLTQYYTRRGDYMLWEDHAFRSSHHLTTTTDQSCPGAEICWLRSGYTNWGHITKLTLGKNSPLNFTPNTKKFNWFYSLSFIFCENFRRLTNQFDRKLLKRRQHGINWATWELTRCGSNSGFSVVYPHSTNLFSITFYMQ